MSVVRIGLNEHIVYMMGEHEISLGLFSMHNKHKLKMQKRFVLFLEICKSWVDNFLNLNTILRYCLRLLTTQLMKWM